MLAHLPPKERALYVGFACVTLFGLGYVGSQKLKQPASFEIKTLQENPTPQAVQIHMVGAVRKPGLYMLKSDQRTHDALDAAGGALAEADLDKLNLAAFLKDGAQIRVPAKGESVAPEATEPEQPAPRHGRKTAPPPHSVDLNRASEEELQQLPGIGASTASLIAQLRTEKGKFTDIEQLREVRGLNGKRFEAMRDFFHL